MELMIADRIKKYRKLQDMTQDALAQALGVSPQSVSKWECGDGYPDITLLPSIANYFNVTVDELIGNDEISAKEDIQKNYFEMIPDMNAEDRVDLGISYYRKYPRNWEIATSLMYEITRNYRVKLDEHIPLLNEICERLLKECTDSVMRRKAVQSMCMVCDEDEIEDWLRKDTEFFYRDQHEVFEERFQLMGDEERHWECRYAGNVIKTAYMLDRLFIRKDYRGKPDESIAFNKMNLSLLDGVTMRSESGIIPDGWIPEYYCAIIRLSAAYFGIGDKDMGYSYLETALELDRRWKELPDGALLDLGNPVFYGQTKLVKNGQELRLPVTGHKFILFDLNTSIISLSEIMTMSSGWEWFDSVRGEMRWNTILEKAKKLSVN